jgi:carotenoid cleavage dioxygenase-like enzyme
LFGVRPLEGTFALECVDGELPESISGRSYMNGPAVFGRGTTVFAHWLDGDGLVTSLRLSDGRAAMTSRFVASTKRTEEEAAGRALYRAFGTAFPGDRLRRGFSLESPVNVSVVPWDGRLLAFGEQGLPWELDPESLETRGEYRFGGRLNEVSPLSAHAHADRESGELLDFGISYASAEPLLHLYRFRDGSLHDRTRFALPYACSTHDFALTERFAVFYLSPHLMDVRGLLERGLSVNDCLSWQPERGAHLMIVDRVAPEHRWTVQLDAGYCLHLANAFERRADGGRGEADELVVDVIELERPIYDQYTPMPELFRDEPAGGPVRYVVDLEAGAIRHRRQGSYRSTPDFPAVDPRGLQRELHEAWMLGMSQAGKAGRKFFDELVRVRFDRGELADRYLAPPGRYLGGEPIFIPELLRGDRDGYVLCQELDPSGEEDPVVDFVLFDAHRLADGPLARLRSPHAIPPGFHAVWVGD